MADITIALDRASSLSLQDQLRQQIVDAIYTGALPPGNKMPSSRMLAQRLGVSRNTVVLVYEDLVADGHLEARDRSGIFVLHKPAGGRIVGRRFPHEGGSPIADRMASVPADNGVRCPPHWSQYPYPFWDGCIDAALVPVQEWRKAVRLASSPRDVAQWSAGNGELDDPMLIDELRTKVLPERGISVLQEEVLVTHSVRQGLQFLITLLLRPDTPVWVEEPVDPELLATLREQGVRVEYFDAETADPLQKGGILVTSVRSGMSSGAWIQPSVVETIAGNNGIVIELSTPADTLEPGAIRPALYANPDSNHVIHVGQLSPVAACGTPLAFVVADASVIARVRRLRRVSGAPPNLLQQRAWAYFLSLGHYDASLQKARRVLAARKTALRDALNHYLHATVKIESVPGVSAYWISCRDGRDAQALPSLAASAGVLVQPARLGKVRGAFTMGVTGIPEDHIREGVRTLARVLRVSHKRKGDNVQARKTLSAAALRRTIIGKMLLYNTVYGEPCTIQVERSGKLVGAAGYANDDLDYGRWWIEGNRWFRQWDHWAYGEAEGFAIAVEDDRLYWYDDAEHVVDKAVILRQPWRKIRATT